MLKFYFKVFRTSFFQTLWYICFMFDVMIDAGPKFYVVWSPTLYLTEVKVTDLKFLYWSLCLSFNKYVFVKPLMPKFYMVPFPTQKVTDSEFLYKSFVINVLQFLFFLQSLQWILFSCGVTIEPCLKFYAVPSQSQCMTLRSRSQTLNFFVLNLYSVSCCKAFDWFESCLVWMDIRF